jgi:3-isopropylmalate/(R)-2-methylmalate dehydratase small subunit
LSRDATSAAAAREYAHQSLYYFGIRAILADGFAEILFGNSTTLGIPCVTLKPADRDELARGIPEHPERDIDIDLTASEPVVRFGAREIRGEIPESTRRKPRRGSVGRARSATRRT